MLRHQNPIFCPAQVGVETRSWNGASGFKARDQSKKLGYQEKVRYVDRATLFWNDRDWHRKISAYSVAVSQLTLLISAPTIHRVIGGHTTSVWKTTWNTWKSCAWNDDSDGCDGIFPSAIAKFAFIIASPTVGFAIVQTTGVSWTRSKTRESQWMLTFWCCHSH